MSRERVIDFVRKIGCQTAVYRRKWNGYDVYEPVYDSRETTLAGNSFVILVSGTGEIRFSTPEEYSDFLDDIESSLV